jgi:AcrR family transcriptional regulator
MFARYGLRSVRMDDIASEMGVSKRTIYEVFSDKENLIEAAVKNFFNKKHDCDMQRTAEAENIIEKLFIGLNNTEESIQQTLVLINDLKKFYPKIYARIMDEISDKGTEGIREAIKIGISEGLFLDNISTELPVSLFIDIAQTIHNRLSSTTETHSFAESVRYFVLFFVRGISTQKGIKKIDKYLTEKYLATN